MPQKEIHYAGINIPTLTFLVFLVLKLTDVIAWSWWWITAPIWGSFVLVVAVAILVSWRHD